MLDKCTDGYVIASNRRQRLCQATALQHFFVGNIHLVTKPKKNINNPFMNLHDKIMLSLRILAKTFNEELKSICYTRHV